MIAKKYIFPLLAFFGMVFIIAITGCERDEDNLQPATFPSTAEVFIDGFSAGLNYAAFGGSDPKAFDVDTEVKYSGSSSMIFKVPDAGAPQGAYAGGVYYTDMGRDLSGYNVLTFWARASKAANIDLIGLGNDLGENKYQASISNVPVNTNWQKYYIPIPDPSKLTEEKGMFFYSEGPEDGKGYTFWIDEVKFEKLGTIAHQKAMILGSEDKTESTFNSLSIPIDGLGVSFNLPTGVDQKVNATPAYFTFSSTEPGVATVSDKGLVTVLSSGTAVITATLGALEAEGSLTIESSGEYEHAPVPQVAADKVISLFSDAYTNEPVDYYNGYWAPYQTTLSADFTVNNDHVLNYYNFNFVGIQFTDPLIDASTMTHFHMDIYTSDPDAATKKLAVQIVDAGADGQLGTDDDSSGKIEISDPQLEPGKWLSIDIPFSSFSELTARAHLAQIILDGNLTGFFADNIYFYEGEVPTPAEAAPAPDKDAANVLSVFSDAYTDLAGTDFNPSWGQATVVTQEAISGNNTMVYKGLNYQGIQLASSLDASGMSYLHIDFWTANATALNIYLISDGPLEKAYALSVPTTGWSGIDIPLSAFAGVDLTKIIQFKFDGNGDIYWDNLYFWKEAAATAPVTAAPTPTQDAANVISVFSDAYTDISGVNFNPNWGQSTVVSTVDIAGNPTLSYATFNYQGTEFPAQDISQMEYIHIDMWTADATNVQFTPISAGTGEKLYSLTPINAGVWNSYDIPLTYFTDAGMQLNDIFQLKFDGQAG
ncbi:MAG: Ig-like domain-containing protein, partial [Flavobacteriaceae bacterium]|nr:Ig-like domain-containing protein [Flavobacteriaceae bacterium]